MKEYTKRDSCMTMEEVIERNTGMSLKAFLTPQPNPYIHNMDRAVEFFKKKVNDAAEEKEILQIKIVGDYDADGMNASAILYDAIISYLKANSLAEYAEVSVRLPRRYSEGYGLSKKIIDESESGLIITVDNGIAAIDAIKKAKDKGIDVIILDHHLSGEELPCADIIVDPHCEGMSTFKHYCGAGLAYRFAEMLITNNSSSSDNISSVTQIPDYKDGSTTTMPGVRDDLVDGGMNAFYTITDTYELFSRFSGSNAMNNYCTLAYIKDIHVDSIRKNVILKTNYKSNVRRWVVEKDGGSKVVVQTDDPKHQFDFSTMDPGEYTVTAYQKVTYTVGTSVKYDICEYLFDPVTNGLIYFNEQTVENGTNKSLSLDTVTKTGYVATGDVFRIHVNNLGKVETVSPSTNRTE